MSDDPIGICCSITLISCVDVCTGICIDFASVRHGCTETMCSCRYCRWSEKDLASDDGERAPLIQQAQPAPSQPMLADDR